MRSLTHYSKSDEACCENIQPKLSKVVPKLHRADWRPRQGAAPIRNPPALQEGVTRVATP